MSIQSSIDDARLRLTQAGANVVDAMTEHSIKPELDSLLKKALLLIRQAHSVLVETDLITSPRHPEFVWKPTARAMEEILALFSKGLSDEQIAEEVGVDPIDIARLRPGRT